MDNENNAVLITLFPCFSRALETKIQVENIIDKKSGESLPLEISKIEKQGILRILMLDLLPGHYHLRLNRGQCNGRIRFQQLPGVSTHVSAQLMKGIGGMLDGWEDSVAGRIPNIGIESVNLSAADDPLRRAIYFARMTATS